MRALIALIEAPVGPMRGELPQCNTTLYSIRPVLVPIFSATIKLVLHQDKTFNFSAHIL